MYDNTSRVIEVDIDKILPNRFQPRIQFDEEEILELSDSIKEHGVIQPLVVRTIGDKYEIIAGERRYKASVLAGKEVVPVIVKNLNDKDSAEIALIENIQRKNLTPIEEALSYKKILDMGYITQENLAYKLGKSQSAVANKIRLLNLSDDVQEALLENKISERHARSLLKLESSRQQNEMLNRIINERLTVRRADEEIEKMKNNLSNESNDDTQKIIEKGEIDMNNSMFGMPNIPQTPQSTPNFDIFGSGVQQQTVEQPQINPTFEPAAAPTIPQTPSFDIFAGSTPVVESAMNPLPETQPVVPSTPIIQPTIPEMPVMGEMQFNPNFNNMAAPTIESTPVVDMPSMASASIMPETQPSVPSAPIVQPTIPEMPVMGEMQFNPNFNNMTAPTIESTPVVDMPSVTSASIIPETQPSATSFIQPATTEQPQTNNVSTLENVVPVTAPIMESPVVDNTVQMPQQFETPFNFGDVNINSVEPQQPEPTIPEFKIPEPIIVTDYSKQYDPVMPQVDVMVPTVDFKEVISAIRECSNKIEQYGFKIDVEEYDLTSLYQVIFKIEK